MRAVVVVCLLVGSLSSLACSAGYVSSTETPEPPDPTEGWPTEPKALVAHLNGWDHGRLEAYERPDLVDIETHMEAKSGDTGEWVDLHKKKLAALGVAVHWNPTARLYEIDH